jgi:hypothetical protein
VPARQVERERDVPGAGVDQAGRAEHHPADAGELGVRAAHRLHHGVVHDADRVVGVLGRLLHPPDDRAGDVRARGDHPVGGDVDADDVGTARGDGVELRVGTAAAGLLADPGHQPALLQPFHQLGRGDLGQPGQLAELRAGQRTAGEQELERGAVVQRPQQARRAGQAGRAHGLSFWGRELLTLFTVALGCLTAQA